MRARAQTPRGGRWACGTALLALLLVGCGGAQPGDKAGSGPPASVAGERGRPPISEGYSATYDHLVDGERDVVTVKVAPARFRLSSECRPGQSSCPTPIDIVVNGRTVVLCSGSPPSQCWPKHLHTRRAAAEAAAIYSADPTPTTLRALDRDIRPDGTGSALGQPTECFHAISKLAGAGPTTYCVLDSNRALASLRARGERWTLTSLTDGAPPPSAFILPGGGE